MSWVQSSREFLKDVRVEFTKVSLPSRKELQSSTAAVMVAVLVIAAFIGVIDRVLSALLNLIFR